jgi:subtilisin family serine protease
MIPAPVSSTPTGLTAQNLSTSAAETDGTPTDQHVFVMNGNSIPDSFAADVTAAGGTVVRLHPEIGVAVVQGLSDDAAATLAQGNGKVQRDVMVQWAPTFEDAQASVLEESLPDAEISAKPPFTALFFPFQWNMRQIHAPEAWATKTGSPKVRVAILDTGLDPDHQDQGTLIDRASSIAFVPSVTGPPTWADDNFHGTHVGGIVVTNNIGTAGVAPNVRLIAIKVLNAAGRGTFADIIAGLIHAANVRADVANLSIGAFFPKDGLGTLIGALNKAVNYANAHDVLVVSAAGNGHIDLQHDQNFVEEPCEAGTGICISSTGPTDTRSSFSNYGVSAIDVAAPGGEIGPPATSWILSLCSSRSTIPQFASCRARNRYIFAFGTSLAAPHVSGTAALLDSQFGGTLNPAQLETALQRCSDDLGKRGADPSFGQGRINVFKTVNEVDCNNSR